MLKKLVLVMFIISILFMVSCSDEDSSTSSESTSNKDRVITGKSSFYHTIDSIWYDESDVAYNYDINNRMVSSISTYYEDPDVSVMEFEYRLPSDIFPQYFTIGSTRINLTYVSGKTKEFIWMFLNEFDVYEEFVKTEYTYENNLLISAVESYNDSKEWVEMNSESWAYESGRLVEYIETDDDRIVYTYSNDKLIEKLEYNWNGSWDLWKKEEYVYQNDLLKEKIQYQDNGGILQNYRKELYEFEESSLSVINEYYWSLSSSDWTNSIKIEYTYDDKWNMLSRVEYDWDSIDEVFIPEYKYDFTYEEESGNLRDISKAMNPEMFYTGLSEEEIYFEPGPSKIDNKVKKVLELLEEKK